MAESMKAILERLKSQNSPQPQPSSQETKVKMPSIPKSQPKSEDDEEDLFEEEEKEEEVKPVSAPKPKEVKEVPKDVEKILQEIELLQNNGRFRAELLFQLQNLNNNLTMLGEIIAEVGKK